MNKEIKSFKINLGYVGLFTAFAITISLTVISIMLLFRQRNIGILLLSIGYFSNLIMFAFIMRNPRTNNNIKGSWMAIFLLVPLGASVAFIMSGWTPWYIRKTYSKAKVLESDLFNSEGNGVVASASNSSIEVISNGIDKYNSILKDIETAKEEINILYFILHDGFFFNELFDLLQKKAKEGVVVRVATDYVGSVSTKNKVFKKLRESGIIINQYNVAIMPFTTGFSNNRNHNKLALIDGKVAYFGGMNIGDEYVNLTTKYGYWEDLHFRATGLLVNTINKQFILEWFRTTGEDLSNIIKTDQAKPVTNNSKTTMLMDGPHYDQTTFKTTLIERINNATESIKIQTPYTTIPFQIEEALSNAVNRGVVVDLITTGLADKKLAFNNGRYYTERLNDIGVNVFRTKDVFMHSKSYVFDGSEAIIGTSNLDFRSIYQHSETNFIVECKTLLAQLDDNFNRTLSISYKDIKSSNQRSMFRSIGWLWHKFISPIL